MTENMTQAEAGEVLRALLAQCPSDLYDSEVREGYGGFYVHIECGHSGWDIFNSEQLAAFIEGARFHAAVRVERLAREANHRQADGKLRSIWGLAEGGGA